MHAYTIAYLSEFGQAQTLEFPGLMDGLGAQAGLLRRSCFLSCSMGES